MKYTIRQNQQARRIIVKVEYPNQVIVITPPRTKSQRVEKFVNQQQNWIKKQLKKLQQKHQQIESQHHVKIFGKDYKKQRKFDANIPVGVHINRQQLLLNFPGSYQPSSIKKEIKLFLRKTSRAYLTQRVEELADKMNVGYNKITLRNQKTRWGSCSSHDNLSLNWRLVHYHPNLIDYVLIHELAHLVHHNHSHRFWQLVTKFDPDYQKHRQQLKKRGVTFS